MNQDATLTSVTADPNVTSTTVYVLNVSEDVIATGSNYSANFIATFSPAVSLQEGQTYYIVNDRGLEGHNRVFASSFTFPSNQSYVNWTGGYTQDANSSVPYDIVNITFSSDAFNFTQQSFTTPQFASGIWNFEACDDEGVCGFAENNFTIGPNVLINTTTFNATTIETQSETFILQMTIPSGSTISVPVINYNNTNITATSTINGVDANISATFDIPTNNVTNTFYFQFDIDGATFTTDNSTQDVDALIFGITNSSLTSSYINFTFADENNETALDGTIPTSNFTYYLGSGSVSKELIFTDNTANSSFSFGLLPSHPTLNIDYRIQYEAAGYQQRFTEPPITAFTNATTNTTLYLLATVDGQYVTFQVINPSNQVIDGVLVNATRVVGSTQELVGTGTTDSAGSVTLWLDPDFTHTFSFSKTGLPTTTEIFSPTQTQYTITMGEAVTSENSTTRGIKYSVIPTNSFLLNDTDYTFGFNLTSSYWDIDEYGFNLRYTNGTTVTGGSTSTSGTPLTLSRNTGNESIIYMDYYWVISGNYTNASRYWIIQNTDNTGWSISTFFTDLNAYLDSGFFGLDNFGRTFIVFIILLFSIGIMNYKFGFTSPLAVTFTAFSIIFFFDVVLNLIPELNENIVNLPTVIAGVVLLFTILMEVNRR